MSDGGNGDIEDIKVLALDEIQQQVQRSLKGFEKHLQRIGRNVEILWHDRDGLALHDSERHFSLQRRLFRSNNF